MTKINKKQSIKYSLGFLHPARFGPMVNTFWFFSIYKKYLSFFCCNNWELTNFAIIWYQWSVFLIWPGYHSPIPILPSTKRKRRTNPPLRTQNKMYSLAKWKFLYHHFYTPLSFFIFFFFLVPYPKIYNSITRISSYFFFIF